jgi:type II secretory pathway pseudopilin PulG
MQNSEIKPNKKNNIPNRRGDRPRSPVPTNPAHNLANALPARDGSALIWSMVVVIILLILIGIMMTVAQASYHGQKVSQISTQAYYTARSVNERIADWLRDTPNEMPGAGASDQQTFIQKLKDESPNSITQSYDASDLDPDGKMGSAEAEVAINDEGTVITITVAGIFADNRETVVNTLMADTDLSHSYQDANFKYFTSGSAFDPDNTTVAYAEVSGDRSVTYGAVEKELNNMPRDSSPVIVGNESLEDASDYRDNTKDQSAANAIITSNSIRELTWRNRESQTTTLGTTYYPILAAGDTDNDKSDIRRLVTPKNGRWTLNPLQRSGSVTASSHQDNPTASNNARIIDLSMGEFGGKDLEIRLGGYNINPSGSDNDLINDPDFYNSLLMFDFTDNAGANNILTNSDIEYYDGNVYAQTPQHHWYPQKWSSMTIYTQNVPAGATNPSKTDVDGGVNAHLVFGPFAHKFDTYIDYWNYGRYTGNPRYGQTAGDFNRAFPGNDGDNSNALKRRGMAYMPEYFGSDFRMFFLDNTDKNVLIMQGVNILGTDERHSVIYSRRGVEIGGGLVKSDSTDGPTNRNVNSNVDGMDLGTASNYPNYPAITARYSQILYNTDIVLRTPNGVTTPRTSRILDATLPTDGYYGQNNNYSDATNKKFSPTVKIIGGYMYVGEGQTLVIEGGRVNPNANGSVSGSGSTENEQTLTVSPTSITIAPGGAVELESSSYANVNTDIFVNGSGSLNLKPGARARGNIIVEGGVVTKGGVVMGGSSGVVTAYEGDVFVREGGSFTVKAGANITGDIYVSSGGALTIEGGTITGDIRCAGVLNINGNFTLNYTPDSVTGGDNPDTEDVDESVRDANGNYIYHGIFIYNHPALGTGTLNIPFQYYTISGNSGRIHAFAGYPGIPYQQGNYIFCSDEPNGRESNNACKHWKTTTSTWQKQGDSIRG